MKRSMLALAFVALAAFGLPDDAASVPSSPSAFAPTSVEADAALVQLAGEPLSVSPRTRPARGSRIEFNSEAVRSERAQLAAVRNAFRRWLQGNAPKARVTSEFDLAVHALGVELNGTSLATVRSAPMVRSAELQALFRPNAHDDPDLSLVRANQAWAIAGGAAGAGAGVKVAIIDTGIDVDHPCFDDAGYPLQAQIGDPALTNNKVIVARVFSNRIKQDGWDARAVNGHGTHVAGTVACNAHSPAIVDGVDIPYDPSGVAPRALLGNYNVFPGESGSARSEDILQGLEQAYSDGFHVANMSLGGARNAGGGAFLLNNAVDNLDRANMVVAVAAGNEGPGYFTVHYPGAAARALTAGASTVGHGVVNQVRVGGVDYEAVIGEFGELTADLTAPLRVVSDPLSTFPHGLSVACDTGPPLPDLTGSIVLLGRGECDFTVKMRNAQAAGAAGVIMVNRIAGSPFVMAHNGLEPQPTIPGVMVSLADGAVIDDHGGVPATLTALGVYVQQPEETNLMANFSSWGPTQGDLLVKPDVTAPGADVLSAFPAASCSAPPCWAFLGGTSMATPHVAGAAAVVRGVHPDWTAAEVRSAVTNTARQGLLRHPDTGAVTDDALIVGAGLLDVAAAIGVVAALDPVSQSFGQLTTGSGATRTAPIVVTNIGTVSRTYTASVTGDAPDGVTFSTNGGTFTLAPGGSRTVSVSVSSVKGAAEGNRQAELTLVSGGTEVAHAMLYGLVGQGVRAPGQYMLPPPKA